MSPPCPDSQFWQMHFDGSKMMSGLGAGIILTSPKGDKLKYVLQIHFAASNNVAEYEALVHGIKLAKEIGIRRILCYGQRDQAFPRIRVNLHSGQPENGRARSTESGQEAEAREAIGRTRGCRSATRGCCH